MLSSAVLALAASMVAGQADQLPSNYEHLKSYDLLIGTWTMKDKWFEDTPGGVKKGTPFTAKITWKWILDKGAIEGEWWIEFEGSAKVSGKALVGWDRSEHRMILGGMDSSGGYSAGVVTFDAQGKTWTQNEQGASPEGKKTTQTIVLTYKDANALLWQIKDRTGDGTLPDSPTLTFKRADH